MLSGIEIPLSALRAQVASAVDVVVHTARLSDGSRKIVAVSEVLPLDGGNYRLRDLVAWRTDRRLDDGGLEGTFEMKNEPTFAAQARQLGLTVPSVD